GARLLPGVGLEDRPLQAARARDERPGRADAAVVVRAADHRHAAVARQRHARAESPVSGLAAPEQLRLLCPRGGAGEGPGRADAAVVVRAADQRLVAVSRERDAVAERRTVAVARGELRTLLCPGPRAAVEAEDEGGAVGVRVRRRADDRGSAACRAR